MLSIRNTGRLPSLTTLISHLDQRLLLRAQTKQLKTLCRPDFFQLAAILLSIFIYALLGFLAFTAITELATTRSILRVIAALLLLLVVTLSIWPRFMRQPDAIDIADPDSLPELNRLIADIAHRLQVEKPQIVMTNRFEASFGRIGFRRAPLIRLGHPLIATLNQSELVAVLAHEMGHARDATVTRSILVRVAHLAVIRWRKPIKALLSIPIKSIATPLAVLTCPLNCALLALDALFSFLNARDAQRAEYVADCHSLNLAGEFDSRALSTRFLYGYLPEINAAYEEASPQRCTVALLEAVAALSPHEEAWLGRLTSTNFNNWRSLHPPASHRFAFAKSYPHNDADIVDDFDFVVIQNEITHWPQIYADRLTAPPTTSIPANRANPHSTRLVTQ